MASRWLVVTLAIVAIVLALVTAGAFALLRCLDACPAAGSPESVRQAILIDGGLGAPVLGIVGLVVYFRKARVGAILMLAASAALFGVALVMLKPQDFFPSALLLAIAGALALRRS